MAKDSNTAVESIRAAGTPMPGKKQGKKLTKEQMAKRSKNDMILERLSKIEEALSQVGPIIQQHEQQTRIGALERHVALQILEQQFGRELIESLMEKRAEHFGLKISYEKEKVDNDDQDDTDEPDSGSTDLPGDEEYEGSQEYSE